MLGVGAYLLWFPQPGGQPFCKKSGTEEPRNACFPTYNICFRRHVFFLHTVRGRMISEYIFRNRLIHPIGFKARSPEKPVVVDLQQFKNLMVSIWSHGQL